MKLIYTYAINLQLSLSLSILATTICWSDYLPHTLAVWTSNLMVITIRHDKWNPYAACSSKETCYCTPGKCCCSRSLPIDIPIVISAVWTWTQFNLFAIYKHSFHRRARIGRLLIVDIRHSLGPIKNRRILILCHIWLSNCNVVIFLNSLFRLFYVFRLSNSIDFVFELLLGKISRKKIFGRLRNLCLVVVLIHFICKINNNWSW